MNDREIRDLFKTHEVPIAQADVWKVQGKTTVIKHSALERLAAKLKISWDQPREIIATMTEVVILARGTRPDGISEWSYGEVKVVKASGDGGNYKITGAQPGYPFAMAEKRAKDRVIIKLAGLHGAYSEEEAEDFSSRNADSSGGRRDRDERDERPSDRDRAEEAPETAQDGGSAPEADAPPKDEVKAARERRNTRKADKPEPEPEARTNEGDSPEVDDLRSAIQRARTIDAVTDLMMKDETKRLLASLDDDTREDLRTAGKDRLKALGWPSKGEKSAA